MTKGESIKRMFIFVLNIPASNVMIKYSANFYLNFLQARFLENHLSYKMILGGWEVLTAGLLCDTSLI